MVAIVRYAYAVLQHTALSGKADSGPTNISEWESSSPNA